MKEIKDSMIRYTLLISLSFFVFSSICFSDYRFREKIAPGVMYYHEYRSAGPWHIHVLQIDLNNSSISLEAALAKNSLFGREKTSEISAGKSQTDHYVAGAINADFFEWNGNPVGAQIINGLLINEPIDRSVFGMTRDRQPIIGIFDWSGEFNIINTSTYEIKGINQRRNSHEWFLFNSFFTDDTLSLTEGTFLKARLVSDKFCMNEPMEFRLLSNKYFTQLIVDPSRISKNEIILIGPYDTNTDPDPDKNFQVQLNLTPVVDKMDMLVGGLPRIIRDGEVSIEWENENIRESFSSNRHPRTAVGFTKNEAVVMFFVVDGRQPGYSMGMSLPELAKYMREWGIYQGVNLDGGGSSTMIVKGEIANKPSDPSGERPVANALMVINKNKTTPAIRLNVIPDEIELYPGSKFQFKVDLQDENFLPVEDRVASIRWFCPQDLGIVDNGGVFLANDSPKTGYIFVQDGAKIDSAKITIMDTLLTPTN